MSFQDNKFPILLGVVTVVVTGGLVFWSMKSGGKYEAAKEDYDSAKSKIDSVMRRPIKPTDENLRAKKKAVEEYGEAVSKLQSAFDSRRQPTLENIEPSAYTDALIAARKRVLAEFEKANAEVPDAFFLGHGKFSDAPPLKKNTGVLNFELGAFEELLVNLAQAGPTKLNNVYWPGMPEMPEDAAIVAHPLEISFTGPESSLRKFLSSLDDSDKYYYAVRTMRVRNERDTAPNAKDARFQSAEPATPAAGGADDPFGAGGFVFPEDDDADDEGGDDAAEEPADDSAEEEETAPEPAPEPEDSGDSSEILKQVLGTEDVQVFLRIDVLQFLEPRELP